MTSVTSKPTQYRIRPGDTLSKIAQANNTTVGKLKKDNGIKDANKIFAGQTLRIDTFEAKPSKSGSTKGSGGKTNPSGDTFTDKPQVKETGSKTPTTSTKPPANEELGGLSRKYEARGPGTVSTGSGDAGGVSYGSYQFASKTGSAKEFVNSLKTTHPDYYAKLSTSKPGSAEFTKAWKDLAAKDPKGFDKAQHDYIKTKFYDVSAADVKKNNGIDLDQRSHALRDVVWSTSVQHGPHAVDDIIKTALKGRDPAKVSDEQLIKDIYAERGRRGANGELVHFSKSSKAVQEGVAQRFQNEQKDALAELKNEGKTQPSQTTTKPATDKGTTSKPATDKGTTSKPTTEVDKKDTAEVKPSGDKPAKHVKVPYYSQFEGGHGYTPSDTACFLAATAMAKSAGATVTGPDNRIQVGKSENSVGRLTVDSKKAAEGRNYIDKQLDAGKPVVVGVSHKDATYNADGLTDHFVTITGRGVDEKGRAYYTFHDPGTTNASKGKDTNPNNRFYVDDKTGLMYRPGKEANGYVTERRYEVAMVRRNA